MNEALVVEASIQLLPIDLIRASSTNPRQRIDLARLQDLQSSIATSGMQTPMIVRDKLDYFELVSGSRRLRAAENLGWKTAPCIVREMTDAEARQWQIIENLQRENVHPLEEAEAFQVLLEDVGSIAEVATRLGKEQSYVAKCLRLMALTLPSRDALRGGLMSIEHAMLLARLAETEQNAALKWMLDHSAGSKTTVYKVVEDRLGRRQQEEEDRREKPGAASRYFRPSWEPQSVVRLKAWIEAESGILLSRAPWSLTDEDYLLPDVGPCCECPKNTKANTPLFGDLEMGEATCTDGACFAAKTAGFVQIAMRSAGHDETTKPKLLVPRLSWKLSSVKPSIIPNERPTDGNGRETANPAKLLKKGQWVEAKVASCTNVRPGVTADWSDDADRGYMGDGKKLRIPGEVLQVCIAVGCKVHPKDWEKPKSAGNQQQRRDPEAEKRALEEQEHVEKVEGKVRAKMLLAILGKLDLAMAMRLITDQRHDLPRWRKYVLSAMPDLNGAMVDILALFCNDFTQAFYPNGYWLMQPGGVANSRADAFALAKAVGLDGNKLVAEYFHEQGSIAPASDRLYPLGVPWPKDKSRSSAGAKDDNKKAKATAKKAAPAKVVPAKKAQASKARPVATKAVAKKGVKVAAKKVVAKKAVAAKGRKAVGK